MSRVSLNDMRSKVEAKEEFKGSSVFAEKVAGKPLYVVYSYGYHFPMYVFDEVIGEWIGNSSKYSVTTSKHQSKCRPNSVRYEMDTNELRKLIDIGGFIQYKTLRVTE